MYIQVIKSRLFFLPCIIMRQQLLFTIYENTHGQAQLLVKTWPVISLLLALDFLKISRTLTLKIVIDLFINCSLMGSWRSVRLVNRLTRLHSARLAMFILKKMATRWHRSWITLSSKWNIVTYIWISDYSKWLAQRLKLWGSAPWGILADFLIIRERNKLWKYDV